MNIKKFLLLFFGLSIFLTGIAQNKDQYLKTGFGIGYTQVLDQAVAPLNYNGPGLCGNIGHYILDEKSLSRFDFIYQFGMISPSVGSAGSSYHKMDFMYSYLYRISANKQGFSAFLGGALNFMNDLSLHDSYSNNFAIYTSYASLGPSCEFSYTMKLFQHPFRIGAQISTAIAAYVIRPAFSYYMPEKIVSDSNKSAWDYISSGNFMSLGSFRNLYSMISASYELKNGNIIALNYSWNYQDIDINNRKQTGNHSLFFSTLFKF